MMRLSASKISLARECTYWLRPEVPFGAETTTKSGPTGKLFHALVAEAMGVAVAPEDMTGADAAKAKRMLGAWMRWRADDVPQRWPWVTRWEYEVAYLYDLRTGEARRAASKKEIADRPDHVLAAIVDMLGFDETLTSAVVVDYKTGAKTEAASVNGQVALAALALMRDRRPLVVREVWGALAYVKQRKPFDVDAARFTRLDTADLEDEIRALVASAPASTPRPGDHCWRCRARHSCPAQGRGDGQWMPQPIDEERKATTARETAA